MPNTQRDWESLPQFISWEHYEAMTPNALAELCSEMGRQIEAIQAQMPRAELIVGRSQRAKALVRARSLHSRLREILQQVSETPTHTHQL